MRDELQTCQSVSSHQSIHPSMSMASCVCCEGPLQPSTATVTQSSSLTVHRGYSLWLFHHASTQNSPVETNMRVQASDLWLTTTHCRQADLSAGRGRREGCRWSVCHGCRSYVCAHTLKLLSLSSKLRLD